MVRYGVQEKEVPLRLLACVFFALAAFGAVAAMPFGFPAWIALPVEFLCVCGVLKYQPYEG